MKDIQNTAFCVEKIFIHSCIHLSENIVRSQTPLFTEHLNTSHIEHLLNTYYAASARDLPETNKQIIANTLGCHNLSYFQNTLEKQKRN